MSKKKTKLISVNPFDGVIVHQTEEFKRVVARNKHQKDYIKSILNNDITVSVGEAGVGKSVVAAGIAIQLLMEEKVNKIILTRPVAIHPEDNLGFLPGNIDEKMYPFLKPLYDNILKFISRNQLEGLKKEGKIEIVPFAYLRGSNVEDLMLVEESQNITRRQMRMLISRLCSGGKLVISGDPSQSDLPPSQRGALENLADYLIRKEFLGTSVIEFEKGDSYRHPLANTIADEIENPERNDYEEPIRDAWRNLYE